MSARPHPVDRACRKGECCVDRRKVERETAKERRRDRAAERRAAARAVKVAAFDASIASLDKALLAAWELAHSAVLKMTKERDALAKQRARCARNG